MTTEFTRLTSFIQQLDTASISTERQDLLRPLVDFIRSKMEQDAPANLNFICTHNSRRSHLAQVWAQTMAHHFGVAGVTCYSGGTEATALFPVIAKTLSQEGFEVAKSSAESNPVYNIRYAEDAPTIVGFSKTYDDPFNAASDFAAIMTCSQADADCPFIPGAASRIAITYEDPKSSDGTAHQEATYRERSHQIATEMKFVFSQIQH